MEKPLTLKDFEFSPVIYNTEELLNADNERVFIHLSIELFKELAQFVAILGCLYKLDENDNPRLWTRDEAILGGLMIRCIKLMHGLLDNVCRNRMELANIFTRCLGETIVNLKYLLTYKSSNLFDEFVAYSLRTEKKLLEEIEENIKTRGYELSIETRMKKSVNKSFEKSGITPEDVNSSERSVWGGSIYQRFKKLGLEKGYLGIFGIQSHFVHGNWQELLRYHLNFENGYFSPNTDWDRTSPQPIFALGIILGETSLQYLDVFTSDGIEKEYLKGMIEDLVSRIIEVDSLHEQYLQRKTGAI